MTTAKEVVSSIVDGDLNKANDAFDAVMDAKRAEAWSNAKLDVARTSFSSPVEEPETEEEE